MTHRIVSRQEWLAAHAAHLVHEKQVTRQRDALAAAAVALGQIGLDHEDIKEIDINPLILAGSQPVAADAVVVLK